mmetsp:Transcript_4996/g.18196  ORF Transcript_4996/g.18196 Transcript_4996/m.18196 type:complete len:480 (+) Transcript_4996:577-2016(+)
MRAQSPHQALSKHADDSRADQIARHAQILQARDRRDRVVGVQRAEHQVAGQCGLDRHFGRLEVADLADHDDVRVLAHQRAQALGESEVQHALHLGLVERRLDHLDRVLDGRHVDLVRGEALERRVQRGRLAAAGRPGHQDDAVGLLDQALPAVGVVLPEAERSQVLHRGLRVEDAHHHLFAKGRGQRRQTHLDLVTGRVARLDPAIQRAPFLDHIHPAEQLDARGHRAHHRRRQLIDRVQHAVDAEANHAHLAARFQVNIRRTLVEGVLPQPVHHLHDTLVVGVELLVALAQFDELLKARHLALLTRLRRGAHRAGKREELCRVARDLQRVGHHQLDRLAHMRLDLRHPAGVEGLGGGDRHVGHAELHRQAALRLGIADGHHIRHTAHVHLERIDAQIRQARAHRQPLRQRVHVERLAGGQLHQAGVAQPHQRVQCTVPRAQPLLGAQRLGLVDQPIAQQPLQQQPPLQPALRLGRARG